MPFEPRLMLSVLAGIHLVALPMYPRLPLSILLTTALLTLWSWLLFSNRASRPPRLVMVLLAGLVVVLLYLTYGTIVGQQAGSSMLLLLSFLKLFEMKKRSDIMIVIFMGYFLTTTNFFFSQDILTAVYVFVVVLYLTSLMIVFSDRTGATQMQQRLASSFRMVLYAIPLMLILFVLFPRIPGPLWTMPEDEHAATTGLSDEMSPGSINKLISSGEVAFRVRFLGGDPPYRPELYWRGIVLSDYDGKTWRRDDAPVYSQPMIIDTGDTGNRYRYTVMLEAHNQHWLYALEQLVDYAGPYTLSREMQLLSKNKITDLVSYTIRSDTGVHNISLFEQEHAKNLRLPAEMNPLTVELAKDMYAQAGHDQDAYIKSVLQFFNKENFVYTLSPPLLGQNAMADFLFNTRRGFCGHYTSAFVYMMRAAGIPARVVIGYQGGTMHPFDDYMIVRQSDAHAWAEVWDSDWGWERVDPTAAVSPDRIERGIESAVSERDMLPAILVSSSVLFKRVRYMMDSIQSNWNQWVVGFNHKRQRQLLELLGFDNISIGNLVLWMVIVMTLTGAVVAWWLVRKRPGGHGDAVKKAYLNFCAKLGKAGIEHDNHEGSRELLSRAIKALPSKKQELCLITGDYERLRYGSDSNEQRLKQFKRAVRRFRI